MVGQGCKQIPGSQGLSLRCQPVGQGICFCLWYALRLKERIYNSDMFYSLTKDYEHRYLSLFRGVISLFTQLDFIQRKQRAYSTMDCRGGVDIHCLCFTLKTYNVVFYIFIACAYGFKTCSNRENKDGVVLRTILLIMFM